MKMFWIFIAGVFVSANALTFEEIHRCLDKVEIEGKSYEEQFGTLFLLFVDENFGFYPPGLYFESAIRDSVLYIVKAGICFMPSEYFGISEMEPIEIPLNVIFPGANSDTIRADAINSEGLLFSKEGLPSGELLIKDGRLYRFVDSSSEEDEGFRTFYKAVEKKVYHTDRLLSSRDPRFIALLKRLRPYCDEKIWNIVLRSLRWKEDLTEE